jgi:predicted transcriptional regulator
MKKSCLYLSKFRSIFRPIYQKAFLASVNKGLADVENGNVVSTEQLKAAFSERRRNRKNL